MGLLLFLNVHLYSHDFPHNAKKLSIKRNLRSSALNIFKEI